MPLKILLMIVASGAANWLFYEQPLLTRMAVGIVAAVMSLSPSIVGCSAESNGHDPSAGQAPQAPPMCGVGSVEGRHFRLPKVEIEKWRSTKSSSFRAQ